MERNVAKKKGCGRLMFRMLTHVSFVRNAAVFPTTIRCDLLRHVPATVDRPSLVDRLTKAIGHHEGELPSGDVMSLPLEEANHNLSKPPEAATQFVEAVGEPLAAAEAP